MTKPSAPTKADLQRMLAEAVRNTQPQRLEPQPEPARNDKPAAKRVSLPSKTRTMQERKTKSIRPSARGKRKPR